MIVIITISGCIDNNEEIVIDSSNGLIINEFSIDPLSVQDNEAVSFLIDIENVGGRDATDIKVLIHGLQNNWRNNSNRSLIESEQIELIEGGLQNPDINLNIKGESKIISKTYYPPELPENINFDSELTARVKYRYTTTSSFIIPIISENEYKNRVRTNTPINSQIISQNTDGPLKITLSKGDSPIILTSGNNKPNFIFNIRNVGNGFPGNENDLGKIRVMPKQSNNYNNSCNNLDDVKLRTDGSFPLACTLTIESNFVNTIGTIQITFELTYDYFIDETRTVSVIGTGKSVSTPIPTENRCIENEEDYNDCRECYSKCENNPTCFIKCDSMYTP